MLHVVWIRRRRQLMSAAAVGGLCLLCVGHPANSGAEPAAEDAIARASYGDAEIRLRRKSDDRRRRELVFRATPGAPERVVGVTVPQRNTSFTSEWSENLALGLDGAGALTVVVQSKQGLYWTRVAGRPQLRHIAGTGKADVFPSVFRGRIAYVRAAATRSSVRLGSLTRGFERTLWSSGSRDVAAREPAIGAGDAVAFVTVADGAEDGLFDARLVRPRMRAALDLWPGSRRNGGVSLAVATSGRQLAVTAARSRTVVRYALPSGRRLTSTGAGRP